MNEDYIIAAILTVGLLAQNKEEPLQPGEIVSLYGLCLTELLESNRVKREFEDTD